MTNYPACIVCAQPIDHCSGHGAFGHVIVEFVTHEMDDYAQEQIVTLVHAGARWRRDPAVDNVIGLVGPNNSAYVVLYLDDWDFECSAAFEEASFQ